MKLTNGYHLTAEGRQVASILDGLLRTTGLPNRPDMRGYAGMKRAGVTPAQIFQDYPETAQTLARWVVSPGGARRWIAAAQIEARLKRTRRKP